MADAPLSLSELAQALTQLTRVLAATLEDQRQFRRVLQRVVLVQTVLIIVVILLLFFLTYQIRAQHIETAALIKTLLALVDGRPPH